jgi:spore coat protein SA
LDHDMKYHVFDEREQFSEFKGGAISRWAASVLRRDEDTHIVCAGADESWGFDSARIHCVPSLSFYMKLRARKFYPPWLNGTILRSLYSKYFPRLKEGDVVWVHGQPAVVLALAPWVRKAKAKLVLHLHGSLFVTTPSHTMAAVAKAVDRLVFCSSFLEQEARVGYPNLKRTHILYNGADDSLFYPAAREANGKPVILVACRLVPEKGVHLMLPAMKVLEQRGVNAQARILGSSFFGGSPPSPYVEELHRTAPANVDLAGYYAGKDLADQFRAADIFCLPAIYNDPFPLAVIEGMASGLPVVTTRRGGIPEALAEGGGVFFDPSAPPEQLADVLESLIQDAESRVKIGQEGFRSYQKHFTWENIYLAYHEIVDPL